MFMLAKHQSTYCTCILCIPEIIAFIGISLLALNFQVITLYFVKNVEIHSVEYHSCAVFCESRCGRCKEIYLGSVLSEGSGRLNYNSDIASNVV